jgi:hypothetical protein
MRRGTSEIDCLWEIMGAEDEDDAEDADDARAV